MISAVRALTHCLHGRQWRYYRADQTPLGQHVLMVNEITAAEMTPLADVRDQIIEDLKRENATDLVYDRISVLEDEIAAGATIEEAARVSGAALVTIDGMDRNGLDIDGNVLERHRR